MSTPLHVRIALHTRAAMTPSQFEEWLAAAIEGLSVRDRSGLEVQTLAEAGLGADSGLIVKFTDGERVRVTISTERRRPEQIRLPPELFAG